MSTYDRQNVIVTAALALLITLALIGWGLVASNNADELRMEHEHTEQVRINACRTIADDEVRALCISAEPKR